MAQEFPAHAGKFPTGRVVATPGACEGLGMPPNSGGLTLEGMTLLLRHITGDWGDVDEHDRAANDQAVEHEGDHECQERVLSAYTTKLGTKIWIITEWDRSVTTFLLPDEY